jgi:hypothetical protein
MNKRKTTCILFLVASSSLATGCGAALDDETGDPAAPGDVDQLLEPEAQLGVLHQALGQKCESVEIEITNQREEDNGARPDIKITSLEFYNRRTGWHTELVANEIVSYSGSHTFVEDLGNTDGDFIDSWIVNFKYDLGSGWSSVVDDFIDTTNVVCSDAMNVNLTVIEN